MRGALLLALAGCNSIYGLESPNVIPPEDAFTFEPPNCPAIRFGPPAPLVDLSGQEYDGQLSFDGRELWYTVIEQGVINLYRGVRTTGEFTIARFELQNLPHMFDPSLTADGRRLMFIASGNGNADVYEAVRSDPSSAEFESVRAVVGLLDFPAGFTGIDLTWDGLRIYYTGDGALYFASRPGRDDAFGYATRLNANDPTEFAFPSVSADELEIFYNHQGVENGPLYYRNRESTTDAFGPEQVVLNEGVDPDVAPRSDALVVSRANALFVLTRECGPKL